MRDVEVDTTIQINAEIGFDRFGADSLAVELAQEAQITFKELS